MSEQSTPDPQPVSAEGADQTPEQKAMTDLLGAVQRGCEQKGWTSEVVLLGGTTAVLGLTSPDEIPFSLLINKTP